jgi:Domain of unknown function (DUF4158)
VFPEDQLERLRTFPDIGRDDLIRYFTLTRADVAFLDPGRGRGPAERLGLAVALATLPWLGFVPDEVRAAPPAAVARILHRDLCHISSAPYCGSPRRLGAGSSAR